MTPAPANGVDPGWLSLRARADATARTAYSAGLAAELACHVTRRLGGECRVARLVDVGAGTGAGARWLRPRLPVGQDWQLVDHDRRILDASVPTTGGWARGVVASVADLPELLAEDPPDVVTCQALLDVLTAAEVDALLAAAMASGAALLLSLSVTGEVALSPPHPADAAVAEAFDAHQRRGGRLGPGAGAHAAGVLRGNGYAVTTAATPWRLGVSEHALAVAWLHGRAAAAAEQEPGRAGGVARWWRDRDQTARRGELGAVVGHLDVLALPPAPVASGPVPPAPVASGPVPPGPVVPA